MKLHEIREPLEEGLLSTIKEFTSKIKAALKALSSYDIKAYEERNKKTLDEFIENYLDRIRKGEKFTVDQLIEEVKQLSKKDSKLRKIGGTLDESVKSSAIQAIKDLAKVFVALVSFLQSRGVLTTVQRVVTDDPSKLHSLTTHGIGSVIGMILAGMLVASAVVLHVGIETEE